MAAFKGGFRLVTYMKNTFKDANLLWKKFISPYVFVDSAFLTESLYINCAGRMF